jgi:hypothetical protein
MIITTLLIIKIIVTILFVLILSLLAEYVSPKVSGIISGIPTGTAIILFFYALEQGTDFASQSSLFNLVGMLSMQVFIYLYFRASSKNGKINIFISSIIATIGYLIVIFLLKQFQFNILTAPIIPLISIPLFTYLFKKIDNTIIKNKVKLSTKILFIRAIVASVVILLVTSIAQIVGPKWAGLFSAFPTTLFPLILIIHDTYGKEHVHTIIKNVPKGQWSMVIYVISVFFLYPLLGVYLGTLISYLLVILYLIVLFKIHNKT